MAYIEKVLKNLPPPKKNTTRTSDLGKAVE